MASLSLCQFVLRIEFQVKNHFSSELKGITLVVSTFQGSMPHFLPVYSPLVFFLQVLISQFSCSVVSDSCNPMDCSTPVLPVHHQLRDVAQAHVHRVSDTIQLSHPCPLFLLPSIFPSIRVFSNVSVFLGGQNIGVSA